MAIEKMLDGQLNILCALSERSPRVFCRRGQVVAERVRVGFVGVDDSEASSLYCVTSALDSGTDPLGHKDLDGVSIAKSK